VFDKRKQPPHRSFLTKLEYRARIRETTGLLTAYSFLATNQRMQTADERMTYAIGIIKRKELNEDDCEYNHEI
jgi:hypothetical protein